MSFELAAVLVLAIVAVVLGLACYYLLGRLDMLERAVQGGLTAPSVRLSREQFEQRFRTAHARSDLARRIDTGLLLVVGPEHTPDTEISRVLDELARPDLIAIEQSRDLEAADLGITTTPYLFVVDDGSIRTAQPVSGASDIIAALRDFA